MIPFDKKTYNSIRKADFRSMYIFITEIYKQGYKDGQVEASGLTASEVHKILLSIKGIGETRAAEIMQALNLKLDSEQEIEYICGNCGADLSQYKGVPNCPFCTAEMEWK